MLMSPAAYAARVFGSATKLAEAAGVSVSRVSRWRAEKGLIPSPHQAKILDAARTLNLPLTADDLVRGREVAVAAVR
jgi:transcriptional regulator with XRE-family HTH domain